VHTEAVRNPTHPLSGSTPLPAGRLLALYEIGRQMLEERDPVALLRTIHAALVAQLAPDRSCILRGHGPEDAQLVAAHGFAAEEPPAAWPVSWTVLRHVLDGGPAVLASDVRQHAEFGDAGSIQKFRIRSVVCVPLGSPPLGALYVDNKGARPFTVDDLEFVTAAGLYTSLVLARTEELAATSRALERQDERVEILQADLLRHRLVGSSAELLAAYDALRRFAKRGARVLLRGETGTGKELFARAYAAHSPRAGASYVPVTVPALAAGVVESELFGHVRGAFTEAARDKKGRLEVADGGVLFLDEVGDIELPLQTKLLRFLDSGELYRVGDNEARRVDCLVVSATNRVLERDVEQGRFRADLLARLGHVIRIPALRERRSDVPPLVEHFLRVHDREGRKRFAPETLAVLQEHHWPFNVRELQQVVERAVCLVDRDLIVPEDLPEYMSRRAPESGGAAALATLSPAETPRPLKAVLQEVEKAHILRALEHTAGNRRRAMELLQIAPETFYRRLEEFGLHKKGS
jgi:two-component system, NtrC family, response regulator AtoC